MKYRRIYDSLMQKRIVDKIPETQSGENHHTIPRSIGGYDSTVVRLTVREHIFAHELLVLIYRDEEPNQQYYIKMVLALDMMYQNQCKHNKLKFCSRRIAAIREQANMLRRNKTRIYNKDLKITKYWDNSLPIPEGWERGVFLDEEALKKKSETFKDRVWVTNGSKDRFVHKVEVEEMLNDGWVYGRTNLPEDFADRLNENRSKDNHTMRGKKWIYNIETNERKVIEKDQAIPEGWKAGSNLYFKKKEDNIPKYTKLFLEYIDLHYNYKLLQENHDELKHMTHKGFLKMSRDYSKIYHDKKIRDYNRAVMLKQAYEAGGIPECQRIGFKIKDLHNVQAHIRKYGLKIDRGN